ncbi:MAG TPA: YggS family pyridoxal phosphate-dependent enzyme [Lentisphaeria bacterium]|nr:YggS family pyridoxal phosphate-dependent enzyme [Lentisphaeria bacterium]
MHDPAKILAELAAAAPGKPPILLAVTKVFPVEVAQQAYACGLRNFGESRPQELTAKAPLMPEDCLWHMIGRLQRNKVRATIQHAQLIHSVDSLSLLDRIDRIAAEETVTQRVLLQLNISGEAAKAGFSPEAARALAPRFAEYANLAIEGVMSMTPRDASGADRCRIFAATRELRNELADASGLPLPELSMGMSSDYLEATAEGSTIVRLGSALFGPRP